MAMKLAVTLGIALVYFGIGALIHAVFIGSEFYWGSASTLGVMLGWPAIVIAIWALLVIIAFLFIVLVVGLVIGWEALKGRL